MENFKVIIVEDVPLELKGTEGIFRNEIPEAEIIGKAENEIEYWRLMKQQKPDLVLLDLGLGGSTTVGVEICRQTKETSPQVKVLIFTGEILNEKLWVDVLDAGADGICLKSGEDLRRVSAANCSIRRLWSTMRLMNMMSASCAISHLDIPRSRSHRFAVCRLA